MYINVYYRVAVENSDWLVGWLVGWFVRSFVRLFVHSLISFDFIQSVIDWFVIVISFRHGCSVRWSAVRRRRQAMAMKRIVAVNCLTMTSPDRGKQLNHWLLQLIRVQVT